MWWAEYHSIQLFVLLLLTNPTFERSVKSQQTPTSVRQTTQCIAVTPTLGYRPLKWADRWMCADYLHVEHCFVHLTVRLEERWIWTLPSMHWDHCEGMKWIWLSPSMHCDYCEGTDIDIPFNPAWSGITGCARDGFRTFTVYLILLWPEVQTLHFLWTSQHWLQVWLCENGSSLGLWNGWKSQSNLWQVIASHLQD